MITLTNFDRLKFAKELKKKFKENNSTTFKLTNALAKNIEIVYFYMIKKKVKEVIFEKNEEIDILIFHKFKDYIQKHYLANSLIIKTHFKKFNHNELFNLLNIKNYLDYCSSSNIDPIWNKNLLKKEREKIEKNKYLMTYSKFKYLVSCLENIPFSKFNFPTEKGKDRFVFYFNIYSEKSKNQMLEILEKLKVNYEILKLINENKIGTEIYLYAIGFTYINKKEVRVSLYSQFCETMLINNLLIKKFLFEKHKLITKENFRNLWYYAIDYFPDKHKEIKLYDEPYVFNESLENKELFLILKNKICVKTLKYYENKIIDKKYEFHLAKNFSLKEKEKLIKLGYSNENSKILSIYLDNEKIRNYVNYDL